MNTRLFRPQAVAYHALRTEEGRQLDLADRPATWAFRAAVAGILLLGTATVVVHADETARGTALVRPDGRSVHVQLPFGALSRLSSGSPARLRLDGVEYAGQVVAIGAPVASPDAHGDARALVPVDIELTAHADAGEYGVAEVRLSRGPLIALLVPGLRRLTGRVDG
jgi:hypothetical protein